MQVYFLTRKPENRVSHPLITVLSNPEDVSRRVWTSITSGTTAESDVAFDIENRSVFPSREGLLLSAFSLDEQTVYVIDNTSVDNLEVFTPEMLKRCNFVCHNADHEARWGMATSFVPSRYSCTMVNDRRIYAGQDGYRFDLVSVIIRHLGINGVPEWMDKDIRDTFHDTINFSAEQILYNAADTTCLLSVRRKQLEIIEKQNRLFEINSLRSRLIKELAEAEMTGILHNSPKWKQIAEERQKKADKICQELTRIVVEDYSLDVLTVNPEARKKAESQEKRKVRREERIEKLQEQIRRLESAGKTHLKSYKVSLETLDRLLSETETNDLQVTLDTINWGSQKQVVEVLRAIECPLPLKKDKNTRDMKPSLGKEARNSWLTTHDGSPYKGLMSSFDQFKKTIHNVNAFGEKWIEKYVRPNGRVYTMYNQAKTTTGRFACGDKDNGYPNMQQIPKPAEYRECFIADPGRAIITLDFKNCEGIIMIALSGDLGLKAITDMADSHSYLGTKCWRNVFDYRMRMTTDPAEQAKWRELSQTYEMNQSNEQKKKERDIFKNSGGLFPVAYGIHASKVARSAKVTETEGQIFIDTIKNEIPKVIQFLDGKSREAVTTGYVVHNSRTNSVRGFTDVLDHLHYGFPVHKERKSEVETAARNSPIQGTNADLIIESIVTIGLWKRLYEQDIRLLLQVHDELVYDCPAEQADFYMAKISELMGRVAQKYLIPQITMQVSAQHGSTWMK